MTDSTAATPPTLLSTEEAAAYLGISTRTLATLREEPGGPIFLRVGPAARGRISYLPSDLDEYIVSQRTVSLSIEPEQSRTAS